MQWGQRLSEHDHPERPAVTVVEAMGLGTLEALGVPRDGLDALLCWRRRARASQVNGLGTMPGHERTAWRR